MDNTETAAEYARKWESIGCPKEDSFMMGQIEHMLRVRRKRSVELSKELGVPYAIEGYSHFDLGERDFDVFYRVMRKHTFDTLHAHIYRREIHVETIVDILDNSIHDTSVIPKSQPLVQSRLL